MAHLSLLLLGPLTITLDGRPLTSFEYDKVRALLIYLAVESDRPHRREALVGLLWPEQSERAARHSLSQALFKLRQALDERGAAVPFLLITSEAIEFNRASDHELDVATVTNLLTTCEHHSHRHLTTCKVCIQRLEQAMELYRGNFLEQFSVNGSAAFEEWVLVKREGLSRQGLHALTTLVVYHEHHAAYKRAHHYALRQLELDPLREETYRQLMHVLAMSGQRSAALAQYERCRRVLAEELGVEPEAETIAVYERIRNTERENVAAQDFISFSPAPRLHNFPAQPTSFIGREQEMMALGDMLANPLCRLITIIGPGGIGKTRLALHAAAQQNDVFAHGVYFVPLAALPSSEFVVSAIADALHFSFAGREDPKAQLLSYLHEKEMLLVLDNFEHLLDGVGLLANILQRAPTVNLIVTSRERLRLQGEWLFDIEGLNYPEDETTTALEGYGAVQLFLQRARQVWRHFTLTDTSTSVARICQMVEGMPLGIELAAAWVRERSCTDIAREIEHNLGILTRSLHDVPERHQSMRAAFDHSWNLLSEAEQATLRHLSVFRGGFLQDAAQQVASTTIPLLSVLVDKSLLRRSSSGRYDMHELLRQYIQEKLREAGDEEQTQRRHLEYFLGLAETAEFRLDGIEQEVWLTRLDAEHDNLRAAITWSQIADGSAEIGLRIAAALWKFWTIRGHLREGRAWLEHSLAQTVAAGHTVSRAKAFNAAGYIAFHQDDYVAARMFYEQSMAISKTLGDKKNTAYALLGLRTVDSRLVSQAPDPVREQALFEEPLALFRELDDLWGIAMALNTLGSLAQRQGNSITARALHQESLAISRTLQDKRSIARTLNFLGLVAQAQGDLATAQHRFAESLATYQEVGDKWGIAGSLINLGEVARQRGHDVQAVAYYSESLVLVRQMGAKSGIGLLLHNLGCVAQHQGDYQRATALIVESLRLYREIGRKKHIAMCLASLGGVACGTGEPERAARLFGAAEALYEVIGETMDPADRVEYDRNVATVRTLLPANTFVAAWADGQAMSLEQAISYAEVDNDERRV